MTRTDADRLAEIRADLARPVPVAFWPHEYVAALVRLLDSTTSRPDGEPFQARVAPWMQACFGSEISADISERCHRFFEEASETVQALGMTRSEAHQLVDYTWDRPAGAVSQEIGGTMVTLAALSRAAAVDMTTAGETELARIWTKIDVIRAKQAGKPKHSPLPEGARPLREVTTDGLGEPKMPFAETSDLRKTVREHFVRPSAPSEAQVEAVAMARDGATGLDLLFEIAHAAFHALEDGEVRNNFEDRGPDETFIIDPDMAKPLNDALDACEAWAEGQPDPEGFVVHAVEKARTAVLAALSAIGTGGDERGEGEGLRAATKAMQSALGRLRADAIGILNSRTVRNFDETLAEADYADGIARAALEHKEAGNG